MKVFKFGGASIENADRIKNVARIIQDNSSDPLFVVVSALGKTTNKLEAIVNAYLDKSPKTMELLEKIKIEHFSVAKELMPGNATVLEDINELMVTIEWILEEEPDNTYGYFYDQIVSTGELMSSKILSHYLKTSGINARWLDVRDVLFTDNSYTEAVVDWELTQARIDELIKPKIAENEILITQGYIGSTSENFTTTLGREGSDYTGAIFSYCLDATSLTIWKNVEGVLTGDPTLFDNVSLIERLNYTEAIEMTYYGAKVIHPKTIKPLQNKSIPLYVKSFINPTGIGTRIGEEDVLKYPPMVVIEDNQVMLHIRTRDFSFVAENHMVQIFGLIAKSRMKVNLMRNTAISFTICMSRHEQKLLDIMEGLNKDFNVIMDDHLQLITIRHYNDETVEAMKKGKVVLFEEKLEKMMQMVVKIVPVMKMK